jgi:hypothetical protein
MLVTNDGKEILSNCRVGSRSSDPVVFPCRIQEPSADAASKRRTPFADGLTTHTGHTDTSTNALNQAPKKFYADIVSLRTVPSRNKRTRYSTDVCTSCRQSKVRCEEGRPCSRCVKQGWQESCLSWREKESVATAAETPSNPIAQAPTTNIDFTPLSSSTSVADLESSCGRILPVEIRNLPVAHNPATHFVTHLQHVSAGGSGQIYRDPTEGHEYYNEGASRFGGSRQALTAGAVDSILSDEKAWDHLREGTRSIWAPACDFNETTEPYLGSDEEFWAFGF